MRVYISNHDPFIYDIMSEEEVNNTFGDDFIDDYGKEIPDDLYNRYIIAKESFWKIQDEIEKLLKDSNPNLISL